MTVSDFDMAAQQRLEEARTKVAARKAAVAAAGGKRGPMVAVLVIGIGLLAAPFIFQMLAFDNRAPKGGEMIDEFRPYMTEARITQFDTFMALINGAEQSYRTDLRPVVAAAPKDPAQQAALASVDDWAAKWEGPGPSAPPPPPVAGRSGTTARPR